MTLSVHDQLIQLEKARQIVLGNSTLYSQIVQGILPIVGANSRVELRRWGADFLAETFASPLLGTQQKEDLSIVVLQTLRELLELPGQDNNVIKSVVQAAASVYSPVFHYIISHPHDSYTWDRMAAIKSHIFKRWDTAASGIRACCIKFVQKVVQVQTPGVIADPRRTEQNEISLALVPRDHSLIPPSRLEPEAHGLLDRLLNVFHEEQSDAILVNATLNCLGVLIRTRPNTASKIITAVLNFNPLRQANSPMTPKSKVQIKSMERTVRALLLNVLRRNENSPFAARIKQHVDRLAQSRFDAFDEGGRKRALPSEPTDGLDNPKRVRLEVEMPERLAPLPLPAGPVSYAQLFTLTGDRGLTSFDVTQLPIDLVVKITLLVLHRIEQPLLEEAMTAVRARYLSVTTSQQAQTQNHPQALGDEEEDYEPNFDPAPEDSQQLPQDIALGPFKLPQPPPLTREEIEQIGKGTISRVFGMMSVLDETSAIKRHKPGINRLAGSSYDRDSWMTVITRIATRASALLDDDSADEKEEDAKTTAPRQAVTATLSDSIRETIWKFVIEDFRTRIPIAISWLNEEWFNDHIQAESLKEQPKRRHRPKQNYEKWMLKVLDSIVPFLDAKDKVLIRFLSEIPSINERVLDRVKSLARDPDRVTLAVNAIYYLILMRPPVRELCIDALEDLWRNYDDAKGPTTKHLRKWRPRVFGQESDVKSPTSAVNGIKGASAVENKDGLAPTPIQDDAVKSNSKVVAAAG